MSNNQIKVENDKNFVMFVSPLRWKKLLQGGQQSNYAQVLLI